MRSLETLTFQTLSWFAKDVEDDEDENEKRYAIKVFGMDEDGRKIGLTIKGFQPFFYIKIKEPWANDQSITKIMNHIRSSFKSPEHFSINLVKRKDFWGFTNKTEFSFLRLKFMSHAFMKRVVTILGKPCTISGLNITPYKFDIYESNIEPYIRFLHVKKIQPTGWISISKSDCKPTNILESINEIDLECNWKSIHNNSLMKKTAPFVVASFDIECTSSGGEFPVPKKTFKHLATQLYDVHSKCIAGCLNEYNKRNAIIQCLEYALGVTDKCDYIVSKVETKKCLNVDVIKEMIQVRIDEIFTILVSKGKTKDKIIIEITKYLAMAKWLSPLKGDSIIQIGTTFHKYGFKECFYKHIVTLGSCNPIEGVNVEACETEEELILAWRNMIQKTNPDIITGYNIFGFDFDYMFHRADELGILDEFMMLGRFKSLPCKFKEQKLSSSALGDNILKYITMEGRILVDLMKVVQRDHKLDSYKLDNVAFHFTGQRKHDVSPQDIFRLQKGDADDRKRVAEYCIQDCEICNHLVIKLEIIANNMGMSNVCIVPMDYIFMRGQGIKIFSLILNECYQQKMLIPVVKKEFCVRKEDITVIAALAEESAADIEENMKNIVKKSKDDTRLDNFGYFAISAAIMSMAVPKVPMETICAKCYQYANHGDIRKIKAILNENMVECAECNTGDDDSYEGAIVLNPEQGIYIQDPVSVLDYASLYPSSMISENLSHDMIVMDEKYNNLPGVDYLDITYDIYGEGKVKVGERICRFVQGEKGIIPCTLQKLLTARKETRKKMTQVIFQGRVGYTDKKGAIFTDAETGEVTEIDMEETLPHANDEFQMAVLDGLQNAYKVTANSLYGQIGAKQSQIYLKDIAACTTATGRNMIMKAKAFLEENYNARIVYGDTDSIFVTFPGIQGAGKDKIMPSIKKCQEASSVFKKLIKQPHDLEYEKTFWPFILLSKKRYVGNLYEHDDIHFKQKSMGIVLKRRDNANIVKQIYGGIINIILNEKNIEKSIEFMNTQLMDLINGKIDINALVISKSLRADYKDPTKIAHKVLAERIADRDPGNKPQVNDRIPYVYVQQAAPEKGKKLLQGDRIESLDYVITNSLTPDYGFYITNQIMKPILQIYALIVEQLPNFGSKYPEGYLHNIEKNMVSVLKDKDKVSDKMDTMKEILVKELLFDPILLKITDMKLKKSLLAKKYYNKEENAAAALTQIEEGPKKRAPRKKTDTQDAPKKPVASRKKKTLEINIIDVPKPTTPTLRKTPKTMEEVEKDIELNKRNKNKKNLI